MKKRSPLTIILLTIITFGIYYLYWLVSTKAVLNKETKIKIPTVWLLFSPAIATMGIYTASIILVNANSGSKATSSHIGSFLVLLITEFIVGALTFLAWFYWFWKYSKAAEQYTNKEMSSILTFVLLWLLSSAGIAGALIQDKFNDVIDSHNTNNPNPAPMPQPTQSNPLNPVTSSALAPEPLPQNPVTVQSAQVQQPIAQSANQQLSVPVIDSVMPTNNAPVLNQAPTSSVSSVIDSSSSYHTS